MLDWIANWILAIVNSVPPLFAADEEHALLIRAMFGLLLIVLIIYLVVIRPFGKQPPKR